MYSDIKKLSWKISVKFQNAWFRCKSEPEYGMLQIWQHNPIKLKNEGEKVSRLMTPPHTPPFHKSSISNIKKQVSETCSMTSVPLSSPNSSRDTATQMPFQSIFAENGTEGIILPNTEPPYLILLIKEDSVRIPLSLVSIEGKLLLHFFGRSGAYQL
jgi:hypothetical protein